MCRPLRAAIAAAACLVTLAACSSDPSRGYSLQSSFQDDVETVYVPIFGNTTFSHGIEVELTDAIIKEIQRTTPWRVVSTPSAQTTLTGAITRARMQTISTSRRSGLVQELAVAVTVQFEWKDNRTGRVLVSRRSFTGSDTFIPAQGVGEPLEVGEFATVQELARDIVAELRSNW